ncbi:TonB-dependent receptor [Albibacterium bauzanense]|uniref:Iron complex outermembrane receptor protein n=1 Tax=Albibacterium bauzanense TaxID=653929 RepID=A0A4R1LWT1_9SPHI|nr:TonB-dependent receptor [Albibacterium bauzanense]TCK82924.1 iron complex outermembrane receptor protein [Albibacterium bauzanense]
MTILNFKVKVLLSTITIILFSGLLKAQTTDNDRTQRPGSISGTIVSELNEPLTRISIKLEETQTGTITNSEGQFEIKNLSAGSYTITASGIGYTASKQNVRVNAGETTTIDLQLDKATQSLNEVVIQGNTNRFSKKQSDYVSKMPLLNLENPQVYNTVPKELITEQLIFSVDDAIRNAPGIQKMWEATGRSGDGGSYYGTRGFIAQGSLRNGLLGKVTSTVDAINLERLEVIKGPSATLFGSSLTSYGGAINRVTKKPFEQFQSEISFASGTDEFHRVSADVNAPLTKDGKLLFRLNTAYNYEGSFQNVGFQRSFAAAPSLLYQPTDRLSISLDAELSSVKSTGKQMLFFYFPADELGIHNAKDLNLDYKESYMGNGLEQKSRSTNFYGQINYKISDSFTSSTNFSSSHSYSDGFGSYFYLVPNYIVTQDPADVGMSNYMTRADQSTKDSKVTAFEVQQNFNGDFMIGNLRNRIVLGLDFYSTNSNINFFGSEYDTVPLNDPNFDYSSFNGKNLGQMYAEGDIDFTWPDISKTKTYSAFVSDVLDITDNFSVLAALRADKFDNEGGLTGSDAFEGYSQNALSPKFGVVFQPVKDRVSLFANYQNSFTNKGTYLAYDVTAPNNLTQKIADLEHANQIEGGVKINAWQGRLSTTISYYNILVDNILRTDPNPDAAQLSAQVQDGSQRSKGIELDLIANPYKGLNVIAGFSYNDSKFEKSDADVIGRRPTTASSPYQVNLWISYHFPENIVKGLGVGVGGNYASDNKILNSVYYGEFTLPAYTVFNASAFYDYQKVRLSIKVDNISNQKYWIGYTTANPQKPRSMVASLAYKF